MSAINNLDIHSLRYVPANAENPSRAIYVFE